MLGAVLGISYFSVPALLLAPSPLAVRQWKLIYGTGSKTAPPIAMTSALSFACLAYRLRDSTSREAGPAAKFYVMATIATSSIIPFTLVIMRNVNGMLHDRAKDAESLSSDEVLSEIEVAKGESTKQLVDYWGLLNFCRGLLPLTGTVLGFLAAVS